MPDARTRVLRYQIMLENTLESVQQSAQRHARPYRYSGRFKSGKSRRTPVSTLRDIIIVLRMIAVFNDDTSSRGGDPPAGGGGGEDDAATFGVRVTTA